MTWISSVIVPKEPAFRQLRASCKARIESKYNFRSVTLTQMKSRKVQYRAYLWDTIPIVSHNTTRSESYPTAVGKVC